jgi:uncharacterized protein (TIGR02453 family)
MAAPSPRFSADTLKFLRALKRNNRREWFQAHRGDYEAHVRQPMIEIIERLADDLRPFAPDQIASPKVSMFRINRDTRFSDNKAPYKTNVAAVFPTRGFGRTEGGGLYFSISPDELWIGGGMHTPEPKNLLKVRQHISSHLKQLRAIVESPRFRKQFGGLQGEQLQRVPRGFDKTDPAADYLRHRHFIAGASLPAALATEPAFYKTLLQHFREVVPLVGFLNAALLQD